MLKQKRGITLIALIITVIVLLILAGVVINMTVGNDGIISKAKGAVDMYKNAQEQEEAMLGKVENEMYGYVNGSFREETVTLLKSDFEKLGKKPIFIIRDYAQASSNIQTTTSGFGKLLEEVSLAGHGTGNALISVALSSGNDEKYDGTSISILKGKREKNDNSSINFSDQWIGGSGSLELKQGNNVVKGKFIASATIATSYDEKTVIGFISVDGNPLPYYGYSIVLYPD